MQFSPRGEVLGHQKHKLAFSVIGGVVQLLAVVFEWLYVCTSADIAVDTAKRIVVCLLLHLAVLVHHDTDAAEVVSHIEMVFRLAVSDSAVAAVEKYAVEFAVHDDKRTGILHGAVYKQRKGFYLVPTHW